MQKWGKKTVRKGRLTDAAATVKFTQIMTHTYVLTNWESTRHALESTIY